MCVLVWYLCFFLLNSIDLKYINWTCFFFQKQFLFNIFNETAASNKMDKLRMQNIHCFEIFCLFIPSLLKFSKNCKHLFRRFSFQKINSHKNAFFHEKILNWFFCLILFAMLDKLLFFWVQIKLLQTFGDQNWENHTKNSPMN